MDRDGFSPGSLEDWETYVKQIRHTYQEFSRAVAAFSSSPVYKEWVIQEQEQTDEPPSETGEMCHCPCNLGNHQGWLCEGYAEEGLVKSTFSIKFGEIRYPICRPCFREYGPGKDEENDGEVRSDDEAHSSEGSGRRED